MNFVRRLVDLMLFRAGPQDMPGDQSALVISAVAYCILLLIQINLVAPPAMAVTEAILATILLGLYAMGLLHWKGLSNRIPQTVTALFASGTVLRAIILTPTHSLQSYLRSLGSAADPSSVPMPPVVLLLIYFVIGIWGLAIYANIYRHALGVSIGMGVVITIGFEALLIFVFTLLG